MSNAETTLTPEEAAGRTADLAVVDVRTPAEFATGHLPGAYNVPLDRLRQGIPALSSAAGGSGLLFVCASGGRSEQARQVLAGEGVRAASLGGGTTAWRGAGLPVERSEGTPRVWPMERQVRCAAGALVLVGLAGGRFVSPKARVVSALVGGGLVYAGVSGTCGMAAALAKLPFNRPGAADPDFDSTLRALAAR
ncbi:rhodanese-like domain-containing protein [Streptomyces xiaopingdaonensis]|uniref:rhodanese-like domain-containing protein n=1 Tax=Streptomyces xiaopingdaonensis TaxID=1565415 RepID=UPI00031D6FAE|nr:rhodanese-like domain-containing protein [Streptomyces xiaopingdaonensis]